MSETAYYVLDNKDCKHESMTKEQIYTAIEQAVKTGEITNYDTGFITKIKEQNTGKCLTFWIGTSAEYNALTSKSEDMLYILTDECTLADVIIKINELDSNLTTFMENTNSVQDELAAGVSNVEGNLDNIENAIAALENQVEKHTLIYDSTEGVQITHVSQAYKDLFEYSVINFSELKNKIIEIEWAEKRRISEVEPKKIIQTGFLKFRIPDIYLLSDGFPQTYKDTCVFYHNDTNIVNLNLIADISYSAYPVTEYRLKIGGNISSNAPGYATTGTDGIYIMKAYLID